MGAWATCKYCGAVSRFRTDEQTLTRYREGRLPCPSCGRKSGTEYGPADPKKIEEKAAEQGALFGEEQTDG